MVDSIWRYPLKSARGEPLPRVFISASGPDGDRSWACVTAGGLVVSARNPRRWGRLLYVLAMLLPAREGSAVLVCVPGREPLRAGAPEADDALSGWLGQPVRLTREMPPGARLHRLWPAEPGMIPDPGPRARAR